jgi:hypothetical protein
MKTTQTTPATRLVLWYAGTLFCSVKNTRTNQRWMKTYYHAVPWYTDRNGDRHFDIVLRDEDGEV